MIKFTNEIALITAVSDLRMFLDILNGFVDEFLVIISLSVGEKSPSGPIKIHNVSKFFKSSGFKFSFELISANKSLVLLLNFCKKSLSLVTDKISGG